MTWADVWDVVKTDPLMWLFFLQGALAGVATVRSKKSNWFLAVLLSAVTFTAAIWVLRRAGEQQDHSLTYAGIGWLAISLFWIAFSIKLFRQAHPKKPVSKK